MPWSPAQVKTAQAVTHGWKPKGKAKGFSEDFADQVVTESDEMGHRKTTRPKKKAKN